MVTGASTADLGLVLVDARQGLTEQSRRHAVLLSLLRVPHLVLAINKMDLVDWSQEVYEKIHQEFTTFATKLNIPDLEVIPISALQGDNVVNRSENTPWYSGPTLMHHLEHVHVASDRDLVDTRFPVQYVIRPKSDQYHDFRGYAGQVAGGVLKKGDEVVVLPSGMTSTISKVELFDQEIPEAFPPMSVTIHLEDDVDVSRGDMIARPKNAPKPSQDIDAMICWMTNEPLRPRQKLAIKHTTRMGRAMVKDIQYRLDVNSLHRDQEAGELSLNEIGRVQLRTTVPLLCDPYSKNRTTGSFILIDEATGVTVGAGHDQHRQLTGSRWSRVAGVPAAAQGGITGPAGSFGITHIIRVSHRGISTDPSFVAPRGSPRHRLDGTRRGRDSRCAPAGPASPRTTRASDAEVFVLHHSNLCQKSTPPWQTWVRMGRWIRAVPSCLRRPTVRSSADGCAQHAGPAASPRARWPATSCPSPTSPASRAGTDGPLLRPSSPSRCASRSRWSRCSERPTVARSTRSDWRSTMPSCRWSPASPRTPSGTSRRPSNACRPPGRSGWVSARGCSTPERWRPPTARTMRSWSSSP